MKKAAKILLVDDDEDFVEATKIVLEENSFKVTTAFSGKECLDKINQERPDLIILDIMMPKKSGFEVCRELKTSLEYNKIPVLMLTALRKELSRTPYSVSEGFDLEAEDYLDKPVAPKELISRIKSLLTKE
jgi:two-component system alkaline phosphatase synthesis response regulator PhoP